MPCLILSLDDRGNRVGGPGFGRPFFVQHFLGAQALGFYAAAYGIATYLQDVMMAPLQLALFPICMKVWASQGKRRHRNS